MLVVSGANAVRCIDDASRCISRDLSALLTNRSLDHGDLPISDRRDTTLFRFFAIQSDRCCPFLSFFDTHLFDDSPRVYCIMSHVPPRRCRRHTISKMFVALHVVLHGRECSRFKFAKSGMHPRCAAAINRSRTFPAIWSMR